MYQFKVSDKLQVCVTGAKSSIFFYTYDGEIKMKGYK